MIVKDLEGVAVELSRRFEEQLAVLRQEREDLKTKLAAEKAKTAQVKSRDEQPENQPPRAAGNPDQAHFELRAQLDAAKEAAGFAQAALKEEVARRQQFEEQLKSLSSPPSQDGPGSGQGRDLELISLRREREELKRKLKPEQQAATEATRRAQHLEGHFGDATSEFERVKSELVGLTVARDRAQAEWRQQLADAQAVKTSLEMSLGETLARHATHEAELAKLRRENTELTSKLAAEQLAAAQSQHLPGDAKGRSSRAAADSKRAHAELEKLNAERIRAESQWREQLDAVKAIKARLESSLAEALQRQNELEQKVAKLRQERNDFQTRLTAEQQATAQFKKRVDEFEAQARMAPSGMDSAKVEAEMAKLRQERDDLQGRLTAEQQAAAQSKKQAEKFEAHSRKITGDLDHAKAEADKRERAHCELRSQLEAAKETAGFADAALKEEAARRQKLEEQLQTLDSRLKQEQAERNQRLDEELRSLRQERDELGSKLRTLDGRLKQEQSERNQRHDQELSSLRQERDDLKTKLEAQQKAATEAIQRAEELAGRISHDAAESERTKTELEVHNAERERVREDMGIELAGAHAARTRLESSLGEALERGNRFEAELAQLRRDMEDLNSKLAAEQRAAAELRRRAEHAEKDSAAAGEAVLKKEVARREKLEERLKTLSSGLKEEQAERKKRFDKELSSLRTERDALDAKLASEQKETAESIRRAEELECQLSQNASESERAKAELEQLTAERERSETVWREQLDTAFIAKKELAGAWAGAVEQNKRLEEELGKLRREQDELHGNLAAEQQAAAQSKDRASDVESLLNRNASESERIRAELEKQNAEMERMQAEWREQLESAEAVKASLESSLDEARQRNKSFEDEVETLQQERDGLQGELTAELQAAAESTRRDSEAESQLDQSAAELARLNAELQQQRAKLEQSEANWRKQLEAAQAKRTESKKSSGDELAALRRERDDLHAKLTAQLQAAAESTRRAKETESQLDQSTAELDRVNAESQQLRTELEQSDSNWRKQLETAQAKKAESTKGSGAEMAALRRERDDLQAKLTAELRAAAESKRHAQDAESKLSQSAVELNRVNAEFQQQRTKLEQSESKWRKQLETAQARKSEPTKGSGIDVPALRRERDELRAKLTAELQAAAESERRANDAESRLSESDADLERVKAELKRLAANLEHAEAKWRKQSEAAQAHKIESQKILAAADDCNRRLEKELAELRLKYDRLAGKPKSEPPPAPKPAPRVAPVESRPAPQPTSFERSQPVAQDSPWQYPSQTQDYSFDFAKSPPVRRPREPREPVRRRRQP